MNSRNPRFRSEMWLSTLTYKLRWLSRPPVHFWAARSLNLNSHSFHPDIMVSKSHLPQPLPYTRFLTYRQAAQHSQGIQTLLEAEKDAAKVVQEARQCA
jgi:hypothetical protein